MMCAVAHLMAAAPSRAFMASGYNSVNGKIYLIGGFSGNDTGTVQGDTWEYDPVADTWKALAPMP